jgi:hypothetical protein
MLLLQQSNLLTIAKVNNKRVALKSVMSTLNSQGKSGSFQEADAGRTGGDFPAEQLRNNRQRLPDWKELRPF